MGRGGGTPERTENEPHEISSDIMDVVSTVQTDGTGVLVLTSTNSSTLTTDSSADGEVMILAASSSKQEDDDGSTVDGFGSSSNRFRSCVPLASEASPKLEDRVELSLPAP